ncbi:MAG TPA: ABC transporter ATP-binding protein [Kineosporiaceae bacterium]|nr:ABC transporter ATP-binding protein [Kineosporiaceae bacterium]
MAGTRPAPTVVSVQDVSITYRTTVEKRPTFKNAVVQLGRGQRSVRVTEAVKHVSFDVADGTAMGIIGANGAGKSTLMRAMAGILPPTSGRIEVHGRVSTLLSLGIGFNPNLSGRENVVLGGLAAGLTRREIDERYEVIRDFAGIPDLMDLPMRTYSSGQYSRVAFSVAVHMDPDILMIDEALSAGDAAFKKKAAAKMKQLRESARALFLVSHGLQSVREMCNEAIWLDKGRLMMRGEPDAVIKAYTKFLEVGEDAFSLEDL